MRSCYTQAKMALVGGARRSLVIAQGARSFSGSSVVRASQKAPIQVHGLEGRYAHALYSAAATKNCLKEVEEDLKKLNIKRGSVFTEYLVNPSERRTEKLRIIDDALKHVKCNEVTRGFFKTVTETNRVRRIEGIIKGFNQIMTASRGEVACVVTTATQPDQKTLDQVKTILGGYIEANQKISMEVKVNPELIGGMVVEVGDRYCDMSVSTKIRRLSESLSAPL